MFRQGGLDPASSSSFRQMLQELPDAAELIWEAFGMGEGEEKGSTFRTKTRQSSILSIPGLPINQSLPLSCRYDYLCPPPLSLKQGPKIGNKVSLSNRTNTSC
ncbi:UNVERIFIED_CONTAM: hypothetical protein K2H54_015344 [Gekko kuhli]